MAYHASGSSVSTRIDIDDDGAATAVGFVRSADDAMSDMTMYESFSQEALEPLLSTGSAMSAAPAQANASSGYSAHRTGGTWSQFPDKHQGYRAAYASLSRLGGTRGSKGLLLGGFSDEERLPGETAHVVDFETGDLEKLVLTPHLPDGLCQHTTESFDGETFYVLGNASALDWRPLVVNVTNGTVRMPRLTVAHGAFFPINQHCHVSACFTVGASSLRGTTEPEQQIILFGGAYIPDDGVADSPQSHDFVFSLNLTRRLWRMVPKPFTAVVNSNAWPAKRLYHAGCSVDNKFLYIFGGAPDCKNTTSDDPVYDDMWSLHVDAGTWRRINNGVGQRPSKRGSCTMVSMKPFIYLYGGFDGSRSLVDMYRFNIVTEMWQEVSSAADPWLGKALNLPRWGAASCVSRSELVVVGGFTEIAQPSPDDDGDGAAAQPQQFDGRPYKLTNRAAKFTFEPTSLKLLAAQFLVCYFPEMQIE